MIQITFLCVTHQHSVKSQNTWIISSAPVGTLHLTKNFVFSPTTYVPETSPANVTVLHVYEHTF
jgi:hypothetical protein